jgi:tetratricopeptide (TPR) repeat protein
VINQLARGGMGSVFRVLDRLTGRIVTLKQLRPRERSAGGGGPAPSRGRLALATEFQLLATLRHPNIITVLDYGFDQDGRPYFTMDLEENAQSILDASRDRPFGVQVDLLVQALRALTYLHRHGIVHCDVKPDNILVVKDHVSVVDFGLAIHRDSVFVEGIGVGGTFAYMSPEVLRTEKPTPRSDLYSFGMVALEMLSGGHPFALDDFATLQYQIATTSLPRSNDDFDPRLRSILERLLAKRPEDRYSTASEVIDALSAALGQSLHVETVATRESFLQASEFVGRNQEMELLVGLIEGAARGQGSAWLVGGESGVGKSRLLDEVRTRALASGAVVVRGQAAIEGAPYHPWRDVLAHLVLHIEPSDPIAGVLKMVLPQIETILDREVPDAQPLDSEGSQSRLFITVEDLLGAQDRPSVIIVILEDLQWAGSESLEMFDWLSRAVNRLPVILLGSFRNDEAPNLATRLASAHCMTLRRLGQHEIAQLSESMIGPAGRTPSVVELLSRETEGIPFFLVEVVRALAEGAGGLARIAELDLPEHVHSGNMDRIIRRRLSTVPDRCLPALEVSAIIGREIDERLVKRIFLGLDVPEWIATSAACAVLDVRDQQWRFAHDKLREHLQGELASSRRRQLHRFVAEAIEQEYPDHAHHVTALAHHWRGAEEFERELPWAHAAGLLALRSGACHEAVRHLTRALELVRFSTPLPETPSLPAVARRVARTLSPYYWSTRLDLNSGVVPESRTFLLGTIEGELAEALFRLGDLKGSREHGERALRYFDQYVPNNRYGWGAATLRQLLLRLLQSLLRVTSRDPTRARQVAGQIFTVQLRLWETYFYSLETLPLVWSCLRFVNQCEPTGKSPHLAIGYVAISVVAGTASLTKLANKWGEKGLALAQEQCTRRDLAWALSRYSVFHLGRCHWDQATDLLERAAEIAEQVRDLRLWEECRTQRAALMLYAARYPESIDLYHEVRALSRRSGNQQIIVWTVLGEADIVLRLGDSARALEMYEEGIARLDRIANRAESVWAYGMFALAKLRAGDRRGAYRTAIDALSQTRTVPPIAYWMQHGMAATTEVFLSLLEDPSGLDNVTETTLRSQAHRARQCLAQFALRFPLGRPWARIWRGSEAWLIGHRRRALHIWRQSIAAAEQLETPYELAYAHLELGRRLPNTSPARASHLERALYGFERLGCTADVTRTRAVLLDTGVLEGPHRETI